MAGAEDHFRAQGILGIYQFSQKIPEAHRRDRSPADGVVGATSRLDTLCFVVTAAAGIRGAQNANDNRAG